MGLLREGAPGFTCRGAVSRSVLLHPCGGRPAPRSGGRRGAL